MELVGFIRSNRKFNFNTFFLLDQHASCRNDPEMRSMQCDFFFFLIFVFGKGKTVFKMKHLVNNWALTLKISLNVYKQWRGVNDQRTLR